MWFALAQLGMADFGFTPLLLVTAILLPPLIFAGIVPPRGNPFLRGFLIEFGASNVLALLLAVLGWIRSGPFRSQALAALLG